MREAHQLVGEALDEERPAPGRAAQRGLPPLQAPDDTQRCVGREAPLVVVLVGLLRRRARAARVRRAGQEHGAADEDASLARAVGHLEQQAVHPQPRDRPEGLHHDHHTHAAHNTTQG